MYNDLTLIEHNGIYYVDSREVAELLEKRHDHLLRDIAKYRDVIDQVGAPKLGGTSFFIESSYTDNWNRSKPCFLLSKMGCEMVANKLTGEKGILFTAAYVAKFNAMESGHQAQWEQQTLLPTLSEYNDTAKIVLPHLKRMGVPNHRILGFLDGLYDPLGIVVADEGEFDDIPETYTPLQMAYLLGVYSMYGNPHAHAVSCILNEHLHIKGEHKMPTIPDYLQGIVTNFRYDEEAMAAVKRWIRDNRHPSGIQTYGRTYHVVYRKPPIYLVD